MKKILKVVFDVIFIIIIFVVLYNVYDNNRIKIVEQTVNIKDLPSDFEYFKILQISDLHGKTFGENQEKLVNLINSIEYDIIAITGDMASSHNDDMTPFTDILDGINNKDYVFYVQGNVDDEAVNENTNEITEVGQFLIDKGCKILEKPY